MKTEVINKDLAEKLQPFLKDCDCDYMITNDWKVYESNEISVVDTEWISSNKHYEKIYKTLTLDELNKFLEDNRTDESYKYVIKKYQEIKYDLEKMNIKFYENILEYLLKEWLLWK